MEFGEEMMKKFSNGDGYTLYEITKKEVYCML